MILFHLFQKFNVTNVLSVTNIRINLSDDLIFESSAQRDIVLLIELNI